MTTWQWFVVAMMALAVGASVWSYISYFIALGESFGVAEQQLSQRRNEKPRFERRPPEACAKT